MITSYLISCCCMDLWNTNGLSLILQISMNSNFLAFCVQSFECN